ncbi:MULTISPECIES: hypothetical protein [unclassified Serratia (in: enterobacteria)]|uniref:hypothetical protein n=1 Tax=unclassified Serratia (in: enterobacteria) TaxID=2647522 RepID=UPI0030760ED5
MSNERVEFETLEKIGKTLTKLDDACAKIDDKTTTFFGKIKHFYAQEKAIHEIKMLIKECNRFVRLETKSTDKLASDISKDECLRNENLKSVAGAVNKLTVDLDALDNSDESKIKSFIYQTKSLHEIK